MATTENYKSFMERCEVFFPHEDCVQISVAYKLSKFHHRAQVRSDEFDADGNPVRYFEHVRRTALILLDELAIQESSLVICALLHDAVEDTRLGAEEISLVFGPDISRQVLLMSKLPKQQFFGRLVELGDWRSWTVKGCDRLDNIRVLEDASVAFRHKQVLETRTLYYPLMDRLHAEAPVKYQGHVSKLRLQLRLATEAVSQLPNTPSLYAECRRYNSQDAAQIGQLSDLIARAQAELDLSDLALAELFDVSRPSVTRWRSGETYPSSAIRAVVKSKLLQLISERRAAHV